MFSDSVRFRAHQHDRGHLQGWVTSKGSAQLKAVHPRHDEVDEDEIETRRFKGFTEDVERSLTVYSHHGIKSVLGEDSAHDLAYGRTVIDDEDARSH
jgi:hypothetical protein